MHVMQEDHAPPRAGAQALAGTVVYIVRWRADGDISFQGPLARKVASHGARVVQRLTKDVTHVLLQLKPLPSPSERALEQDKLRELYAKVDKVCAMHACSAWWQHLRMGRFSLQRIVWTLNALNAWPADYRAFLVLQTVPHRPATICGDAIVGARHYPAGPTCTGGSHSNKA